VHTLHETVKMDPLLALERHGFIEHVHQKRFSPANATPEIDAAQLWFTPEETPERARPALRLNQFLVKTLELIAGTQLRVIQLVIVLLCSALGMFEKRIPLRLPVARRQRHGLLQAQKPLVDSQSSFVHGFGKGRMGMDDARDILRGGTEFHCNDGFGNEL